MSIDSRQAARHIANIRSETSALEKLVLADVVPPPADPPPPDPPTDPPDEPGTDPPVDPPPPPPTGRLEWAATMRGGATFARTVPVPSAREWLVVGTRSYHVTRTTLGPAVLMVFLERWEGFGATRVTWSLVNGFKDQGLYEFTSLAGPGVQLNGQHAIQVRGTFTKRVYIGTATEVARLENFEHVRLVTGYPSWVEEMCARGLNEEAQYSRTLGPFVLSDADGPRRVFGDSSLNGSHGGWHIGDHSMGSQGWQRASRAGYKWATKRAEGQLNRSQLACFDQGTLRPVNPHVPYWTGATAAHEPAGWDVVSGGADNWCPYIGELVSYRKMSYTHLARLYKPFAMIARHDEWARWVLTELIWHDATMWLDGAESSQNLLKPLSQAMREIPAHKGWSNAGRGLAHTIGAFLEAVPYLPRDDASNWGIRLLDAVRHFAYPNGITQAAGSEWGVPAPTFRAREADIMGLNFKRLGLDELHDAWVRTLSPDRRGRTVGETAESDVRYHWSEGLTSSQGETGRTDYFPPYSALRGDFTWLGGEQHLAGALATPWAQGPAEQLLDLVHPEDLP